MFCFYSTVGWLKLLLYLSHPLSEILLTILSFLHFIQSEINNPNPYCCDSINVKERMISLVYCTGLGVFKLAMRVEINENTSLFQPRVVLCKCGLVSLISAPFLQST